MPIYIVGKSLQDKELDMGTKHYDGLDVMKAIAILAVLTIHVPLWDTDLFKGEKLVFVNVVQYSLRLLSEGVPVFVLINGFLLFGKKTVVIGESIKKAAKCWILIGVWGIGLTVIGLVLQEGLANVSGYRVIGYLLNTQVGAPYTGVLWFLENLSLVYLVFPAIKCIFDKNPQLYHYLLYLTGVCTVGISTLSYLGDIMSIYVDVSTYRSFIQLLERNNPIGNSWYVFYFMLGGYFRIHMNSLIRHRRVLKLIGIGSAACSIGSCIWLSIRMQTVYNTSFNYYSPFMLFMLTAIFANMLCYENRQRPWQILLGNLGQHTMGIYLSHFVFIYMCQRYLHNTGWGGRLTNYIIVLCLSYGFSVVLSKTPRMKYFVSLNWKMK